MTWQELGIDISKLRGNGGKTLCPRCSHDRKRQHLKDPCLSVNLEKKVFNCHNCGFSGGLGAESQKEYARPVPPPEYKFSEKVRLFFEKRGISAHTLQRYQIASKDCHVPQLQASRECIMFPYFRESQLINVKYRDGAKNFFMEKGAELVFFGIDVAKDSNKQEVIITEGEIDCMSFHEASLYHAVSVPNGASKGNQRLDYLDNCWEFFEGKEKVYIATDNDDPGVALREELARRLGKDRCLIVNFFDCKDANEVLKKHGAEFLRHLYQTATPYPIDGVVTVSDMSEDIMKLYQEGYPKADGIGYPELDQLIKWGKSEMTIITGVPNSGKSAFIDQIILILSARIGWRFGIFSPENPTTFHFSKLSQIFIGKPFYAADNRITPEQLELAKQFIGEHFYFIEHTQVDLSVDGLIAKAEEMVRRYGINGFIFDPWNYIEHNIPHGYTETQYISEALTKFKRFKDKCGIHLWIVAHPRKIQKEENGEYKVATPYDISSSAHFFNKADNCLSVWRSLKDGNVRIYTQKIRFNWMGKLGIAEFDYEFNTGRYKEKESSVYQLPVQQYLNRMDLPNEYGLTTESIIEEPINKITAASEVEQEKFPW